MRSLSFAQALWKDLGYGTRLLRLNPGFAAAAILSLALGIGANTSIFQLLTAIRLRSLPVQNPQELSLVSIANRDWASGSFSSRYPSLTNPQWEQIRDRQQAFSSILAWSPDRLNLAVGGEARYAEAIWVSGGFFSVLGVHPYIGRLLTQSDDHKNCGTSGAVIGYSFWQREYGGDTAVLGKKLTLESHPFEIIGVTPPGFFGVEVGRMYDVAIPICAEAIVQGERSRISNRGSWWLASMGRLKPGWTLAQATGQLEAISPMVFQETLSPSYKPDNAKHYLAFKLYAVPADSGFSELRLKYSTPLWMLMAIAGLVVIIACANLANLMLARNSARQKEFAVRLAVGATRPRLIRQLVAESLLIAGVGASLGALLAFDLSQFLVSFLSTQSAPLFVNFGTDWRVFGFATGLAALTCVLFGLGPAVSATRIAPGVVLKAAGRGLTPGRERFGLRRALVISQVALSMVLLVGALLFVRSLRNLTTQDPGFRRYGILVVDVDFTRLNVSKDRRQAYKQDLRELLAKIPGVSNVADASVVPARGTSWRQGILTDGGERNERGFTYLNVISPGYFKTTETTLLAGRDFDGHDTQSSSKVTIVNESFVRKFLAPGNPVGRRFRVAVEHEPYFDVVGVVRDTKYRDLHESFSPTMYTPALQNDDPDEDDQILIRSDAPLMGLIASVEHIFSEVSPEIDIDPHPLSTIIDDSLMRDRLMAMLTGFFGFLAVLVATIGLFGMISYSVARRRNEIGIRMALGAGRVDIVRIVMGEAGFLLVAGILIGTALSLALGKTADSLLFGLRPYDAGTMIAAIGVLSAVAAAASYFPALRASRVDPMTALREE